MFGLRPRWKCERLFSSDLGAIEGCEGKRVFSSFFKAKTVRFLALKPQRGNKHHYVQYFGGRAISQYCTAIK